MTAPDLFTDEPEWWEITGPDGQSLRWRAYPDVSQVAHVALEGWTEGYGWVPLHNRIAREWFWLGLRAGGGK